jgi:DNA invertase Pin-like site-specific DNA recombinase
LDRSGQIWLSVLIHARFSTEEQRQSSIDDQVDACRAFLTSSLPKGTKPSQVTVEVIKEPEVSGEIANRPGINQVWAGIDAKRWDVIIVEESSRLYRHHTKAGELFESAVDAGVRVICPSDYIDTPSGRPTTSMRSSAARSTAGLRPIG